MSWSRKKREIDLEELKRLHGERLDDGEIAQKLGVSRAVIARRRKELGLPVNRRKGRPRQAEEMPAKPATLAQPTSGKKADYVRVIADLRRRRDELNGAIAALEPFAKD